MPENGVVSSLTTLLMPAVHQHAPKVKNKQQLKLTAAALEKIQEQARQEAYERGRKEGFEFGHKEALEQYRNQFEEKIQLLGQFFKDF